MYTNPQNSVRRGSRAALRAGVLAAASAVALTGVGAGQAAAHELPAATAAPTPAGAAQTATQVAQGPAEQVTHVVARGDSLSKVAAQYGYTADDGWRRIYDANPAVENPNVVFAGQELRIPAAGEEIAARELPVVAAPAPAPRRGGAPRARRSATRAAAPGAPAVAGAGVWDQLAACESGGNWSINSGNGYAGGLQFHPRTWTGHGGGQYAPSADQASRDQQIAVAQRVQASQGWGAWPACSRKLGLR